MIRHRDRQIYAMYKGDQFLTEGTWEEICNTLHIKPSTFHTYASGAYRRRLASRKHCRNARVLIKLDNNDLPKE